MSAPTAKTAEASAETSDVPQPSCRKTAAHALTIVRDGVITGEGPTTKGRIHFSRALDADDAAWCARILTASAVEHQPVSRAEAEALFEISDAAAERTDDGRFDDLLAKAVAHHAASEVRPAGAAAHGGAVAGYRHRELGAGRRPSTSTPRCWNGSPARCAASAASTTASRPWSQRCSASPPCRWRNCRTCWIWG